MPPRAPRAARILFCACLFCACLCGATLPAAAAAPLDSSKFVPGRVVVGFDGAASARRFVRGGAHALGLSAITSAPALGFNVLSVPVGTEEEWARRLLAEPGVRYAEPDAWARAAHDPNDSLFPAEWHLRGPKAGTPGSPSVGIRADEAWNISFDSGFLLLAILDSGMDFNHPDLIPNTFTRAPDPPDSLDNDGNGYPNDTHGWNFISNNNDTHDNFDHGTEMAGVLGAAGDGMGISGVLWRTQMLPVKVLDQSGRGPASAVALGIRYAVNAGARVLNLSLTFDGFSTAVYDALGYARENGVIAVVAAGNGSQDLDVGPVYPASYDLDNIVAVAASTRAGGLRESSNHGRRVLLAAPGEGIYTTRLGGGYLTDSGTSMATPIVVGAAALYWNQRPWETYRQVITALGAAVQPTQALQGKVASGGVLDLARLMLEAKGDSFPPARTADLAVVAQAGDSLTLALTAPGEDGFLGRAESYDLRWAPEPLDSHNFDSSHPVALGRPPGFGGARDTLNVGGLPYASTVYLALRTSDRVHNRSPISNVVSARIPLPAVLALSTDHVPVTVETGASDGAEFTVYNRGEQRLEGTLGRFSRPEFSWSVDPSGQAFTLDPGDSVGVVVQCGARGLEPGQYSATGVIHSNDPAAPDRSVVVDLTVTAAGPGPRPSLAGAGAARDPRIAAAPDRLPGFAVRARREPSRGEARFELGSGWSEGGRSLRGRVLDVLGREMAGVEAPAAGLDLVWDGREWGGEQAPSGLYFLMLENPPHRAVVRFVRLR